jgi:hypothetical protein
MSDPKSPRQTGWQARGKLLCIVVFAVVCLRTSLLPVKEERSKPPPPGMSDAGLYLAEIRRIRGGEGYYEAALKELTARGYPMKSLFNWRTPLPMWLIGHLPSDRLGKAMLICFELLLLGMAFEAVERDRGNCKTTSRLGLALRENWLQRLRLLTPPMLAGVLLIGPLLFTLSDFFVVPVFWAGVMMTLSLCAYGAGRRAWGVGFGLAAVFFRELALPYVLLAAAIAAWNRQRRELLFWIVGLLAWAVFYGFHAWKVAAIIPAGARAHPHGWIQCGGLEFVLSTVRINAYLVALPRWMVALYFVAAMVGFAGWNTPLGQRMTLSACVFLVAFGFVGQPFNDYWGIMTAPLMCFGVVQSPAALRDLWKAVASAGPRKESAPASFVQKGS